MRKHTLYVLLICLAALLSACASPTTPAPSTNSPAVSPNPSGADPSSSSADSTAISSASGSTSPSSSVNSTPALSPSPLPSVNTTETSATSSEIDGTAWTLVSLNGNAVADGTQITLGFNNGNQFTGSGGCNGYSGTYTAADDGTWTMYAANTAAACGDENGINEPLMEQERVFLDTFYAVSRYQLSDDQLELQDTAGTTTLIFTSQAPKPTPTAASAAPQPTPVSGSVTLDGSTWRLQQLQGKDLIEGTNITLEFAGERASGYAGCNAYGGTYSAGDDGGLALVEIGGTTRGCFEQEGVLEQESTYLETLTEVATYAINGTNLEMENAAGDTLLTFAPQERFAMNPADLVNTQWRLRSFNGQDLPADTRYTLSFTSDRDANGSTGCRRYSATYAAQGDALQFPNTEMTAIDCMRPRSQGQEIDFLSSFTFGVQYRLSADQLELFPVEGGTLVWEPLREDAAVTQEPTVWTLQGFTEGETTTPVLNGTTITLQFDEDTLRAQGTLSGSAGCNTYRGGYTFGETFAIEPLATTRMACEPAVMDQEQRFLDLLQNVHTYSLDEQLLLQTNDGRGLIFVVQ